MRLAVSRELCQERLLLIFPKAAFDSAINGPMAATGVAGMIYCDTVEDASRDIMEQRYIRPSTVMWLNEEMIRDHTTAEKRDKWYRAALQSKIKSRDLAESWGVTQPQWYSDNSRETLRDETWPGWLELGAAMSKPGMATSDSGPRWALTSEFAALFDPALMGDELTAAIAAWTAKSMSPSGKLKAMAARQMAQAKHAVDVTFPTGEKRRLEPGIASLILQGVIEKWAAKRLVNPMVLTISEPGDKVYVADASRLATVGITIAVSKLLPDALIVDVGVDPVEFWVIEAVATDGPVHERRKADLIEWAKTQNIPPSQLRFLSAFASRNAGPAKRRLKDLAAGTNAWFFDEPDFELAWDEIAPVGLAPVTQLHQAK